MLGIYHSERLGVRFQYPPDWDLEMTEDGPRTTVSVTAPGGTAFGLVTLDDDRPAPAELADEALAALRDDYPGLDAYPALETIDGHKAVGHDVEFFSLDFLNACAIRCFRTRRRTVLMFGQWSETADGDDYGPLFAAVRRSFEETETVTAEDDAAG